MILQKCLPWLFREEAQIHQVDNATSGHLEPIGLGMDPVKRENLFWGLLKGWLNFLIPGTSHTWLIAARGEVRDSRCDFTLFLTITESVWFDLDRISLLCSLSWHVPHAPGSHPLPFRVAIWGEIYLIVWLLAVLLIHTVRRLPFKKTSHKKIEECIWLFL